jgi:hypothetical protein
LHLRGHGAVETRSAVETENLPLTARHQPARQRAEADETPTAARNFYTRDNIPDGILLVPGKTLATMVSKSIVGTYLVQFLEVI